MIYANTRDYLSLLLSVKYTLLKDTLHDYSLEPRPCHNFAFLLEGEAEIKSEGNQIRLRRGDILFIPKNTTYSCRWLAKPKAVFQSLHFSFHPKNDPFFRQRVNVQSLNNENFDELYRTLKQIERYQYAKDENSYLALSAFFKICAELFPSVSIPSNKPTDTTLTPAMEYLEFHYNQAVSVETLSSLCFLSPSRFHYLFKKQTGVSPIVYKNQLAVQYAAQDLLFLQDKSVREIAERHGFSSIVYFERLFKKTTGKTPSQYRKENTLL